MLLRGAKHPGSWRLGSIASFPRRLPRISESLLDLEESPSLVLAAAVEAAGRPGVLIVDQLDAVSTTSGRTSAAFDLVEQLLLESRGSRARAAIHLVVVCREFDWGERPAPATTPARIAPEDRSH